MRQSFVPSLPDGARVLLSGREPPVSGWRSAPGWRGHFTNVQLEALPEPDALELRCRFDVEEAEARRLNRWVRGHPLALKLAAAAVPARPDSHLAETVTHAVVGELTTLYLADVDDPLTRDTLEPVSVVRRVTQSLLAVLVPTAAPSDLEAHLRKLPFVETRFARAASAAITVAVNTNEEKRRCH